MSFFKNKRIWQVFRSDTMAISGVVGVLCLFIPALFAPLLASRYPLLWIEGGQVRLPFLRFLFAPDSPERLVEQLFNFLLLCGLGGGVLWIWRKKKRFFKIAFIAWVAILVGLFIGVPSQADRREYREEATQASVAWFTPIPYGPFEAGAQPNLSPSLEHWMGTDNIGRSVASRMLYGARVSLAVGIIATIIATVIGVIIGMFTGYFRGVIDLAMMRLVELVICFPTFLLLLILISMFKDRGFDQSVLLVIGVIGLTGWIGVTQLVRGEVLKLRDLPYIQSCETLGIPAWQTMIFHILPNIAAPILIMCSFGVAGAILVESSLSFLGFGVQLPTASWGGLLRQAFESDPLRNWHLAVFPGVALFVVLAGFNFMGEGLRKALDTRRYEVEK